MTRITVDSIRLVATTEERPGPFGEVEHLESHTIALQGRPEFFANWLATSAAPSLSA